MHSKVQFYSNVIRGIMRETDELPRSLHLGAKGTLPTALFLTLFFLRDEKLNWGEWSLQFSF